MEWKRQAWKTLREYPKARKDGNRQITDAVETAMQMQRQYYNGDARCRMIDLVYFKKTHTLVGAAVDTGYSIETVKHWNAEILSAVYVGLMRAPE